MTIGGQHTLHELSDLVTNLDSFVATMSASDANSWQTWSANDPAAADDWQRDWQSFVNRWGAASQAAHGAISNMTGAGPSTLGDALAAPISGLVEDFAIVTGGQAPWDTITNEPLYQATLLAYDPGNGDPTAFPDLDRRWSAQTVAPQPVYTVTQPTAPDADLGAYKAADKGVQAVQAIASKAGALVKSALPPTWVMVAGAAAALALLYLVAKAAVAASPAGAVARAVSK